MSERFLIEAKNSDGLPVTNPQETRSEEGYLKDLTIEGTLTIGTAGEIVGASGGFAFLINALGLDITSSNGNLNVGQHLISMFTSDGPILSQLFLRPNGIEVLYNEIPVFLVDTDLDLYRIKKLTITDTTDSTSTTTGAMQTAGGIGVEKSAHIGNSLHTGGLNIKGIYLLDTSINANYTVTANISYVRVDDSGGIGAGVTLPAATGTGKIITIKDVGGSASSIPISISRTGSDTIDGLTSTTIPTNYGVLRVIDGASGRWDII
jgi:hypothetical protein